MDQNLSLQLGIGTEYILDFVIFDPYYNTLRVEVSSSILTPKSSFTFGNVM